VQAGFSKDRGTRDQIANIHWSHRKKQREFIILGAPKSLQMVTAAMKFKDAYSLEEKL